MTLRSMTGFGRAEAETAGWRVDVECKSVNRKRLDPRIKLPDELNALEPRLRELVKERCGRGRVEVRVDFEVMPGAESDSGGLLDPDRFNAIRTQLHELAKRSAVGPVELGDILEFREYFTREDPGEVDEYAETIVRTAAEALDELVASRTSEGRGIAEDLLGHLEDFERALEEYIDRAPTEMEAMRERIRARVEDALDELEGVEPDPQRLAEEVVYHVDRADVSEELQRARSHVANLRELVGESEADEVVGKKIDFYLQELVREANTLSSKSHSAELTDLAVDMKSTVEKMREQAANIE